MSRPESESIVRRVGARVRARRHALGITAADLAERAGLSSRFVSQLEGGSANIAIGRLASVALALEVSVTSLVEAEPSGIVALLGLRGAGKTTLGRRLAKAQDLPFVELDERIEEAAGLSLSEIFVLHGEDYYRRLEVDCLRSLLEGEEAVVLALSGGIVQNSAAYALVRSSCTTVWLKASPEDHMGRVLAQGDQRPMANRDNAMGELRSILAAREPLYAQADAVIDTSDCDEDGALAALLRTARELAAA